MLSRVDARRGDRGGAAHPDRLAASEAELELTIRTARTTPLDLRGVSLGAGGAALDLLRGAGRPIVARYGNDPPHAAAI